MVKSWVSFSGVALESGGDNVSSADVVTGGVGGGGEAVLGKLRIG